MPRIPIAAYLLLSGCAAAVYQEGKTEAETRRDIEICKEHGTLVSPYDPIVALDEAYDCLEKKGYKRGGGAPI